MQELVITQRDVLRNELKEVFKSDVLPLLTSLIPQPKKPEEFLTRKNTAKLLGVSLPTLDEWVKNGTVKAYRIGAHVRFIRSQVEGSLTEIKSIKKIA